MMSLQRDWWGVTLTSRKGPFAAQSLELPEPYSFPASTIRGTSDCWYLSAASNTSSWKKRSVRHHITKHITCSSYLLIILATILYHSFLLATANESLQFVNVTYWCADFLLYQHLKFKMINFQINVESCQKSEASSELYSRHIPLHSMFTLLYSCMNIWWELIIHMLWTQCIPQYITKTSLQPVVTLLIYLGSSELLNVTAIT